MDRTSDALKDVNGDGLSDLGDELAVDVKTVAYEPWRIRKGFPPGALELSHRELRALDDALGASTIETDNVGVDQYSHTLLLHIIEVASAPDSLKLGGLRRNSPVWRLAGTEKPSHDEQPSVEKCLDAVTNLLTYLGEQSHRKEMVAYERARILRKEYGLSRGRNVHSFTDVQAGRLSDISEEWEPTAHDSTRGYEDVDWRMTLQAVHDQAPHAQREAMDIYLEAEQTDQSVADICRARDKDPNVVRNNLQALKRAISKRSRHTYHVHLGPLH